MVMRKTKSFQSQKRSPRPANQETNIRKDGRGRRKKRRKTRRKRAKLRTVPRLSNIVRKVERPT